MKLPARFDEALATSVDGDTWAQADVYRVKARIAQSVNASQAEVLALYETGLEIARRRTNKIFELRVSLDLADYLRNNARHAQAAELLRFVCGSIPEPGECRLVGACEDLLNEIEG